MQQGLWITSRRHVQCCTSVEREGGGGVRGREGSCEREGRCEGGRESAREGGKV